jgi:hypothetical protein
VIAAIRDFYLNLWEEEQLYVSLSNSGEEELPSSS